MRVETPRIKNLRLVVKEKKRASLTTDEHAGGVGCSETEPEPEKQEQK